MKVYLNLSQEIQVRVLEVFERDTTFTNTIFTLVEQEEAELIIVEKLSQLMNPVRFNQYCAIISSGLSDEEWLKKLGPNTKLLNTKFLGLALLMFLKEIARASSGNPSNWFLLAARPVTRRAAFLLFALPCLIWIMKSWIIKTLF